MTYWKWRTRSAMWPLLMFAAWTAMFFGGLGGGSVSTNYQLFVWLSAAAAVSFGLVLIRPDYSPIRVAAVLFAPMAASARLGDWLLAWWWNDAGFNTLAVAAYSLILVTMVYGNPRLMPPPFRNGTAKEMLRHEGGTSG